jgi:hypothetical protein
VRRGIVSGLLFALALSGAAAAASLELHMVKDCAPQDKAYVLEGTTRQYCLMPDKVIDESGVVKAERYPVIARVTLDMTAAATDKLFAVSSENVGNDLAVLFNNRLIFKAAIDAPLKLEKLQLSLNNAPDAVDALVAAFPGPKS